MISISAVFPEDLLLYLGSLCYCKTKLWDRLPHIWLFWVGIGTIQKKLFHFNSHLRWSYICFDRPSPSERVTAGSVTLWHVLNMLLHYCQCQSGHGPDCGCEVYHSFNTSLSQSHKYFLWYHTNNMSCYNESKTDHEL